MTSTDNMDLAEDFIQVYNRLMPWSITVKTLTSWPQRLADEEKQKPMATSAASWA